MQLTCGSAESSKVGSKKLREIYLFSWIQCLETFFASLQGYGLLLSDGFVGGGGGRRRGGRSESAITESIPIMLPSLRATVKKHTFGVSSVIM